MQKTSELILDRIEGKRKLKKYKSKKELGLVEKIFDIGEINIHQDKWLILTQTGSRLKEIGDLLKELGVYYLVFFLQCILLYLLILPLLNLYF